MGSLRMLCGCCVGLPTAQVRGLKASYGSWLPSGPRLSSPPTRGTQILPAWRLQAAEAPGPTWVLTAETQARC
jgi:hypothetical protein